MSAPVISQADRDAVRAYTEGNMQDAVLVRRGNIGTMDPDTLLVTGMTAATPIYTGKARCKPANASGSVEVGEGQIATRQMTISIPHDGGDVHVDDVVLITAIAPGADPLLPNSTWRVIGVDGGGAFSAVRQLSCTAWFASNNWDGS